MRTPQPHDLLRIPPQAALCHDMPAWVTTALQAAPWVVVRRAPHEPERVPVGIRGADRNQRCATSVSLDAIIQTLSPHDLLDRIDTLPCLPVTRALRAAAQILDRTGLRWGPGGSVGFSLATGVRAISSGSDLDLIVTAPHIPPRPLLAALQAGLRTLPVRADVQLALPAGGIALDDLLSGADRVLIRTTDGPVLKDTAALGA